MIRRSMAAVLVVLLPLQQVSCVVYRTRRQPYRNEASDSAALRRLQQEDVELVLHSGEAVLLRNVRLEGREVVGTRELTGWETVNGERHQVNMKVEHRVPLDSLAEIGFLERDAAKTAAVFLLGIGAAAGMVAVLAAAGPSGGDSNGSCPFVYSISGDSARLEGELYSGAVLPSLERRDYLRLSQLTETAGEYRIRLTNEAREAQYTDQLLLLAIDHAPGALVLPDAAGGLHASGRPIAPVSAVDAIGREVTGAVRARDAVSWVSEPFARDPERDLLDGLVLRFVLPADVLRANLLVRIRNTHWADYVLARFLGLMGGMMDVWYSSADAAAGPRAEGFLRAQGLTLTASVWRAGNWTSAGSFPPAGPAAWQDEALPLELAGRAGDTVTVRLMGGALFWGIDYVALDPAGTVPARVQVLEPVRALADDGSDVTALLRNTDNAYQLLPDRGSAVTISYAAPARVPGLERSFVLQSEGYYLIHQKQTSPPDFRELADVQREGFLRYSLREFWRLTRPAATPAPQR